jgi:uncharacterized membrane-anchored protein YhcB (DUF1043 family)
MTILGIVALVAIVIIGVMVLRVKSDPMEKESVRRVLEEEKAKSARPPASSPQGDSEASPSKN